jgi:methenyltetrahydromethanopterin cyclohydrolase
VASPPVSEEAKELVEETLAALEKEDIVIKEEGGGVVCVRRGVNLDGEGKAKTPQVI